MQLMTWSGYMMRCELSDHANRIYFDKDSVFKSFIEGQKIEILISGQT